MTVTTSDRRSTSEISGEERELRIQLAAAYRLADKYGMSELIYTHISLRVPGPTPAYLLNPHGLLFNQITASSLVKLDFAGNLVGPSEWPVNRAGVAIHGAILAARPDINCVFHTHMPYTTAVSALQCGLLPMSQAALRFHGQTAYHDYGRAAGDPAECARLVKDLGDKSVMLLRNHGGITTGKTVCEAFIASYYLEKACQFQILAQSAGAPLVMPADDIIAASGGRPAGDERAWPSLLRMLDREDPSYRD
ncbi:MAG TPA: class II aldolase/adducin family protein [Candidatus Binatia bacterium]|nr:class II aldolase/adducin family protein [Candidatus Binatia bacterium]